jgi:cytoskeletal protein CcmA (bactofilin family)
MKRSRRNRVILFIAIFLGAFFLPASARADNGVLYGDTIPAGVVVDHDVVLIGQNVSIEGTVNGNVFILGNQVVVNGTVDGSLVMIAQNAAIGGEVSGAVYTAALTLDLPGAASLGRDLYAASVSLTSKPASHIGRHLFALGLDAGLNGQVGGDLHTLIGPIQLYNGLMHLLGFDELTIELHFEIPPGNTSSPQGRLPGPRMRLRLLEPLPAFDWAAWGLNLLRSWGVLFVFGLLVFWLARQPLEKSGDPLRARPWQTLGLGLLVLVIALNLFLVALLLAALIFALGLGLNALGLWQVSLAVWVVAYSGLAVALTGLCLFIAFGAKILVAYHFVAWLFEKFALQKTLWLGILALLVGTILYALLRSIPYVGWAIGVLITSAGMGAAWTAYRSSVQPLRVATDKKPVRAVR